MSALETKLDHLVLGWMNTHIYTLKETSVIHCYEPLLINIVKAYLGANVFLTFSEDLLNKSRMKLIDNHTIKHCLASNLEGELGASALIDLPIGVYDQITISWKIQIQGISFPNYIYFVGITTNRCRNFERSAHSGLKDAFGICGKGGSLKYGGTYKEFPDKSSTEGTFNSMDIVEVTYVFDGTLRQLQFRNISANQMIHVMELPTDNQLEKKYPGVTHWYPAISTRDDGDFCWIVN